MLVEYKRYNGKGIIYYNTKEWDSMAINPLIVMCTFGLSLVGAKENIQRKKTCDCCGGTGILKIKEI